MKRVTSIDVAKLAGVSQSTVSRVFAPNAAVSAETTTRVLNAAVELGYRPNALARGLITQSSGIVGVVVTDVASQFYPYFLTTLTRRLNETGRRPLVFTVAPEQPVEEVLPVLLQYQVDALVIAATTLSADAATDVARDGTPVVLFNRTTRLPNVNTVSVDNFEGGRQIATLFLENEHQRYSFIAGLTDTQSNEQRQLGFCSRLQEAGIAQPQIAQGAYTYQSGFDAALQLLRSPLRPDAIFCANDLMALGAIDAARSLGLQVPQNVSIAGFDGLPESAWDAYQLTTVRQPIRRLVATAIDAIDAGQTGELSLLQGELIVRNSVRNRSGYG